MGRGSLRARDDDSDDPALSAALVEDLTAHRTAALRAVLATRPDVALVAVTHSLALRVCYPMEMTYEVGSALSLSSEKGGCRLDSLTRKTSRRVSLKCGWMRSITNG